MLNTTIVDRRSSKQEVHNHTETNIEASGSIIKENKNSRFININKSKEAFKTIFSSAPFYIETEQVQDGEIDNNARNPWKVPYYKTTKTKILVDVKQVLVVGSDYTLEVFEISKKDISEGHDTSTDKNKYFNTPTIL